MKWLALAAAFIIVKPLLTLVRRNPRLAQTPWMLIGFLPFVITFPYLYMAVYSSPLWGGYVKGAEVSILDILVIALYFSLPSEKQPLPFRFVMAFYFLMVVLSSFEALQPRLALLYPWQLARMFLLYATVTRGCSDPRAPTAIMTGLGMAMIMEAGVAIWQRFGIGEIQTGGTMGHQNLLGVMSHFAILPLFALILAGQRGLFPIVALLAGLVVVVSTASRGAIGLEGFGLAVIFVLSSARKWTPWKGRILVAGLVAMALIGPLVASSLQERFNTIPEIGSYDEREAYLDSARLMLADHPFGIGANHFAVIANIGDYYKRGGVHIYASGLSGNVHNFYYLTAAEIGYQGLFALVILLVSPLIVAFRCGWRNRGDYRGDLLLGLGVTLLTVCLHSWIEWSMATFPVQYLMAITIGLVAGNAQQLGYWSSRRPGAVRG